MSKRPSTNADLSLLVSKVLENLGGKDKAWEIIDADFRETQLRWRQDVEVLGRILRSHLYLEQYLTDYLERANPHLAIRKAALRFSQKLDLISSLPQFAEMSLELGTLTPLEIVSLTDHLRKLLRRMSKSFFKQGCLLL